MRLTPIPEVFQLEPDQIITGIRGTLSKLYKSKTGSNSNGAWSIQGGELTDGQGGKVELFIKDHDEVSQAWKGREIIVTAHKGEKGWSGLYAFDDSYKDKVTRKVKITKTAEIALCENPDHTTAAEPPPQRPAGKPPVTQSAPANEPRTAATTAEAGAQGIKAAKALALQIGNCQILAAAVVDTQVIPQIKARTGQETCVEMRTSLIMNMCIQLQHAYAHEKLPTHTMKAETTSPKPQPPADGPPPQQHPKPTQRPSNVAASAEWDAESGSWYDPETGNYYF